jgi:DNA replication protein DnaC
VTAVCDSRSDLTRAYTSTLYTSRCPTNTTVLAMGNSGTGKTHIGLALGLAACQQGFRVGFDNSTWPTLMLDLAHRNSLIPRKS